MQVLELSGIGDPDVLQKAGIDVVVDLRGVGNNAQEHFYVPLTYRAGICLWYFVTTVLILSNRGKGRT